MVFGVLRRWLIPEQASLLYLPMVIVIAVRYDFAASVTASILGFFCWDYFFIPPYGTLAISDPRDWLSLLVFLIAALFTADVAARARRQTRDAEARSRESEILYQASEAINREVDPERLLQRLVHKIVQVCEPKRCMVLAWNTANHELVLDACSPPCEQSDIPPGVMRVALAVLHDRQPIGFRNNRQDWLDELNKLGIAAEPIATDAQGIYIALHVQGVSHGVLYAGLHADGTGFSAQEQRFILTLANHAGIVMARQTAMHDSNDQARANAIAEERNRLARDIHDTLSHAFNGIKFLLEAAEHVGATTQGQECIAEARRLAQEGAQEARRSVWALRPAALERSPDLAGAIWSMSKSITGQPMATDVSISGRPTPLPAETEENLFRIAQEAVTNVVRHSRATTVHIELAYEDDRITLTVQDNGTGIPAESASGFGMESHATASGAN